MVTIFSLEYSMWFCAEQEYAHCVSLPSRTRWFSPTINWWRCHWRSLRRGTSRTGYFYLLTCTSHWSCRWSCRWGLGRGEINVALDCASLFLFCHTVPFPDIHEHSSGRRPLRLPPSKD